MDTRTRKVQISKAGGNASKGALHYKISLPNLWMGDMGIVEGDRDLEMTYNPKTKMITIKKYEEDKKMNNLEKVVKEMFAEDEIDHIDLENGLVEGSNDEYIWQVQFHDLDNLSDYSGRHNGYGVGTIWTNWTWGYNPGYKIKEAE